MAVIVSCKKHKTMATSLILSDDWLDAARHRADPIADELLDLLYLPEHQYWLSWVGTFCRKITDTSSQLPDNAPIFLKTYFNDYQWVIASDKQLIRQATSFFEAYSEPILTMLGCYALPYCYAAANGAQVLFFSERLRHNTTQRLLETAQFLQQVTNPLAWKSPYTVAATVAKIRLIHAFARRHTGMHQEWKKEWGVPVNQEDMAGTNLAFSLIVLRGLRRIGIEVNTKEAQAYLYLWNRVAIGLGIEQELISSNLREAYQLDQCISRRNFRPSEAGQALSKSLMDSLEQQLPDNQIKKQLPQYMRFLLGNEIADLLDLPKVKTTSLMQWLVLGNSLKSIWPQTGTFQLKQSLPNSI